MEKWGQREKKRCGDISNIMITINISKCINVFVYLCISFFFFLIQCLRCWNPIPTIVMSAHQAGESRDTGRKKKAVRSRWIKWGRKEVALGQKAAECTLKPIEKHMVTLMVWKWSGVLRDEKWDVRLVAQDVEEQTRLVERRSWAPTKGVLGGRSSVDPRGRQKHPGVSRRNNRELEP